MVKDDTMQKFLHAVFVVLIASLTLPTSVNASPARKEWCDVQITQDLLSSAANKMFGPISQATDAEYRARKDWVRKSVDIAKGRFQQRTGQNFDTFQNQSNGEWLKWIKKC